ncbi:MAG: 4Fe-4S dicluster domain-containing protein [Anaerolineae bacterium]|nr:4Fe-4S dicluster domain-containing protein [Anaerolineae bacterium]
MTLVDEFMVAFGVWEVPRPYIHVIVDEREMELIVRMQGQPMTVDEVAGLLEMTRDQASALLKRCYSRCIVDKTVEDGVTKYAPSDFYARLDHFAKFENWDDVPAEDRKVIDRRFLDEFIARHRPNVERKKRGLAAENALPNDTILLLIEVEEMIDAATDIIVQPCDCRRLGQNCDRPVETCIWLDEGAREALDRGFGRRLTKEGAKELVRWADKKGLMHTADSEWQTRGLHAICNCCACDCYPFRAARELGSKGVWPRSRYIVVYDRERCTLCRVCVKRCHFGAFYHDGSTVEVDGKTRKSIRFEPEECWGCGLCANTCPSGAIVMESLKES